MSPSCTTVRVKSAMSRSAPLNTINRGRVSSSRSTRRELPIHPRVEHPTPRKAHSASAASRTGAGTSTSAATIGPSISSSPKYITWSRTHRGRRRGDRGGGGVTRRRSSQTRRRARAAGVATSNSTSNPREEDAPLDGSSRLARQRAPVSARARDPGRGPRATPATAPWSFGAPRIPRVALGKVPIVQHLPYEPRGVRVRAARQASSPGEMLRPSPSSGGKL